MARTPSVVDDEPRTIVFVAEPQLRKDLDLLARTAPFGARTRSGVIRALLVEGIARHHAATGARP